MRYLLFLLLMAGAAPGQNIDTATVTQAEKLIAVAKVFQDATDFNKKPPEKFRH